MFNFCNYTDCKKRATYGLKRNEPIRCKLHKENMDYCSRICICGISRPSFNETGETIPICCSSCKKPNMVNVISKTCYYCGCGKANPTYNEPGETKAICCKSCKKPNMVNVVSKKCLCNKTVPHYNFQGEQKPICCSSCKKPNMVNVKSKRCLCGKAHPSYNEPGETKAICCKSCKKSNMVDVKSKLCLCRKARPNYNEPGETKAICCNSCKKPNMVNVNNKKCPGLINDAGVCPFDSGGNTKYNDYCAECFRRNFPTHPLTFQIRSKTKEIAVRDYINANFEGFQHDKIMTTSHCDCSIKRRIDHRYLINNTLLVVETDENQHKSYDKMDEEIRYDDLYMAFSGKWIYIRFNPDKYISNKGIRKNPTIASRLPILKKEIQNQISRIKNNENTELLERIYMYYDKYD